VFNFDGLKKCGTTGIMILREQINGGADGDGAGEGQLLLPGARELMSATGLMDLPVGFSDLSPQQRRFCINFLACGNATKAAREAGYVEPDSQSVRLMKKPAVAKFLGQAARRLAADSDALLKRAMDRSVWLHAELAEARNRRMESEGAGDFRRERALHEMVGKADTLVAALLGKLSVNVSGSIEHNHTVSVITPETRGQLILLQEEIGLREGAA
jgi:hypothetical protein